MQNTDKKMTTPTTYNHFEFSMVNGKIDEHLTTTTKNEKAVSTNYKPEQQSFISDFAESALGRMAKL